MGSFRRPEDHRPLLALARRGDRGEPEERGSPDDEAGADERPFAPAGHERAREDPDALEEEDTSGKERERRDDTDGEPHRLSRSFRRAKSASPFLERRDDRSKASALLGQLVLDSRRHRRMNGSRKETELLEIA